MSAANVRLERLLATTPAYDPLAHEAGFAGVHGGPAERRTRDPEVVREAERARLTCTEASNTQPGATNLMAGYTSSRSSTPTS